MKQPQQPQEPQANKKQVGAEPDLSKKAQRPTQQQQPKQSSQGFNQAQQSSVEDYSDEQEDGTTRSRH